jgi:hypothetical protein
VSLADAGLVFVGHLANAQGWWPTSAVILPFIVISMVAAQFNRRAAQKAPGSGDPQTALPEHHSPHVALDRSEVDAIAPAPHR